MKTLLASVLVSLSFVSAALGQVMPGATVVPAVAGQAPMVPVPPAGYIPPVQPGYVPPGLPVQEWRDGMREEFTRVDRHDVRPLREYEYAVPQQPGYYNQAYSYPQYQYPTYSYYQQPQTYCCPQQTYCAPQCQSYWYCRPSNCCPNQCWWYRY